MYDVFLKTAYGSFAHPRQTMDMIDMYLYDIEFWAHKDNAYGEICTMSASERFLDEERLASLKNYLDAIARQLPTLDDVKAFIEYESGLAAGGWDPQRVQAFVDQRPLPGPLQAADDRNTEMDQCM